MFKEDFPGSLYGSPTPEPDQEAIDQAIEDQETKQPGPPPTAEEVGDETEGQALRDIQAAEEKLADAVSKEVHPDVDNGQ